MFEPKINQDAVVRDLYYKSINLMGDKGANANLVEYNQNGYTQGINNQNGDPIFIVDSFYGLKYEASFNELGDCTRFAFYQDDVMMSSKNCEYDDAGRCLSEKHDYDADGIVDYLAQAQYFEDGTYEVTYDKLGRQIPSNSNVLKYQNCADGKTDITERYDAQGRLRFIRTEKIEGEQFPVYEEEYDAFGNKIRESSIYDTPIMPNYHDTWEYDAQGRLIAESRVVEQKDFLGKLMQKFGLLNDGSYSYQYGYDEQGNRYTIK